MDYLSDDDLLAAFEAGTIAPDAFPHARHVRVAWGLARKYGNREGLERLTDGLRDMATRAGRPEAYHTTITRAWFQLIASVEDLGEHDELLDKALLARYYTPERLAAGREQWLEPDLQPLRLPAPHPLRRIPTAVAVLATAAGDAVHAATVSSITSVSRVPPLVSVSLANASRSLELLNHAGAFTLSVLASGQADVAKHFASRTRPVGAAQFDQVPHHMSAFGPMLDDAAVRLGCEVHGQHECGDHTLVIGAIRTVEARADVHPLLQYSGMFR